MTVMRLPAIHMLQQTALKPATLAASGGVSVQVSALMKKMLMNTLQRAEERLQRYKLAQIGPWRLEIAVSGTVCETAGHAPKTVLV